MASYWVQYLGTIVRVPFLIGVVSESFRSTLRWLFH